ncbi:MAG: Fic/DOC family protein [Gammaproteobacteria bacterium]
MSKIYVNGTPAGWGSVYEWAGKYRSVILTKDGFVFAAAHLIPKLLGEYEEKYLRAYTPCEGMEKPTLIEALSVCHVEFIIIYPFRGGIGRLVRLLATVMALQANMPPLDFAVLESDKERYVSAIHAGHAGSYDPMRLLFDEILKSSLA